MRSANPARPGQAGFTLIELLIVLALSLVTGAIVYRITRASWLVYNTQTHFAERGLTGLRALDDMAIEIARAGYGLGEDAGPLFPGTLAGVRARDAISVRSNPDGIAGVLQQDLTERDQLVAVEGAALFAVGDDVLLADEEGTVERARVSNVRFDTLAFVSVNGKGGRLQARFLKSRDARVLKVREVGFYLKEDSTGTTVLARKAPGQTEQTLARFVGELRFQYVDTDGEEMDPALIGAAVARGAVAPGAILITLRLVPNPSLPRVTVPPLALRVPLEPQSATIAFDTFAFHRVGVTAIVGQDPVSGERKAGLLGWRKSEPLF